MKVKSLLSGIIIYILIFSIKRIILLIVKRRWVYWILNNWKLSLQS